MRFSAHYMKLRSFWRIMAIQPILNKILPNLKDVSFKAVHNNGYYDINSNTADEAHIHACIEIYINVTGEISFLHGNTISDVIKGDAIVSSPSSVHHCIYKNSCTHEHFCIWITGDFICDFLKRHNIFGLVRLSEESKERLIFLANKLSNYSLEDFLKATYLLELISLLASEKENKLELEPNKLSEILAYIDANYLTISCSSDIAKRFYISSATLNRLFKNHVGISVGRLIEAKKLSHAQKLLKENASVTDACYLSGFNDCSRFIERFKLKFGLTPLKYKQNVFNKK